jgi:hypothetical protein
MSTAIARNSPCADDTLAAAIAGATWGAGEAS